MRKGACSKASFELKRSLCSCEQWQVQQESYEGRPSQWGRACISATAFALYNKAVYLIWSAVSTELRNISCGSHNKVCDRPCSRPRVTTAAEEQQRQHQLSKVNWCWRMRSAAGDCGQKVPSSLLATAAQVVRVPPTMACSCASWQCSSWSLCRQSRKAGRPQNGIDLHLSKRQCAQTAVHTGSSRCLCSKRGNRIDARLLGPAFAQEFLA